MFFIAQRFGVTLQALIAANPQITDPNLIFPGQVICVPQQAPGIPTVECCLLLFRTANVPFDTPEAAGVVRVFQSAQAGGSFLVSTIGLPAPSTLAGQTYIAWIRRTG